MKVQDKRFWARANRDSADDPAPPETPETAADEAIEAVEDAELKAARERADGAERKLQELQRAFVAAKADLESVRERLLRDADRKIDLRFGDLVADLLESVDDLDRAIEHGSTIPEAGPVVHGVVLARDRFLAALEKSGVTRIDPAGGSFDPNVAEAVGVLPVSDPEHHDTVMQVVRPGYALGGRIIRPARVLVGRLVS